MPQTVPFCAHTSSLTPPLLLLAPELSEDEPPLEVEPPLVLEPPELLDPSPPLDEDDERCARP